MRTRCIASLLMAALALSARAQSETTLPLTADQWLKASCGALSGTADGLVVSGTDYRSGNAARSRAVFDFTGGSDTFIRFMPVDTGYAGFNVGLDGMPVLFLTTDHSFMGSVVIAKNTWHYLRIRVNPDRTLQQVLATGSWDTSGGAVVTSGSATLSDAKWAKLSVGQVVAGFGDNYSGTATQVLVGEARTSAIPVAIPLGGSLTYDFSDGAIPSTFGFQGSPWSAADGTLSLTTSGNQTSSAWLYPVGAQQVSFRVKVDINQRNWGWDADADLYVNQRGGDVFEFDQWLTRPASSCWLERTYVLPPGLGAQTVTWQYFEDNRYSGSPSPTPHRFALDDVTVTCPAGQRVEVTATQELSCVPANAPPTIAAAQDALVVPEGQVAANDLAAADADGDVLTVTASAGVVSPNPAGGWRWSMPAVDGPALQEIEVTAADGRGGLASTRFTVETTNVPPAAGAIVGVPDQPLAPGAAISLAAAFTDPGVLDSHAATWSFGDGAVVAGAVSESGGAGETTAAHAWDAPGVYPVTCTVTDQDGAATTVAAEVTVASPEVGDLVAVGEVSSPAGTCRRHPRHHGHLRFVVFAGVHPGSTAPRGLAELVLEHGRMTFHASRLDELAAADGRAVLRGAGRLDGRPGHAFRLTAHDGVPDRLRVQIWDEATGALEYDSAPGAGDGEAETPPLRRGFVAIGDLGHPGHRHGPFRR